MRLKRMLVVLMAVTALAAIAASSAQAVPHWKIEGENWPASNEEEVSCGIHKNGETSVPLVFHSKFLGAKVTLTAKNVECPGATITKGGVLSKGTLKFTGVTVMLEEKSEESTCKVTGGTLTTEPLKDELVMDGANVIDKFSPVTGTKFVTVNFEGGGCSLAGNSAEVKGTACGLAQHTSPAGTFVSNTTVQTGSTEVLRESNTLVFSEANQTTGGCALTLGKEPAQLTGAVTNKLAGVKNANKPFGAGE